VAVCSYPEHWISALGSRIIRIHVKDFKRTPSWYRGHFVNLFEGDIDWQSVMTTLRQTGYNGPITAELSAMPRQPDYLYRITAEALSRMIT
jgi:hexulose-6-phosphate isomerase